MRMHRWIQRSVPLAAAALVGAAPAAFAQAQGQELFEWSGRVDREVQIVMRGNNVWTNQIGQTESGRARSRAFSALPRQDGQVVVQTMNGRGEVDVIQQPSAQNGYTTIVRVRDGRSGSDNYRLAAYWQGYSNGEYVGRDRGRGRGRGRDGDDDRSRQYPQNGQYPNGQYPNGQYPNGQYPNGQYGNQAMLHWSGNVDDLLEIRIQNGQVTYRTLSGAQPTSIRASGVNSAMPRSNAQVGVIQNQGRGQVTVVQQPSQWNGYTTVLRVRDPQGGYGYYDFDLMWQ